MTASVSSSLTTALADRPSETGGIVVGIDGSEGSATALAWAAARTATFGPVTPYAVWTYPTWAFADPMVPAAPAVSPIDYADSTTRQAAEVIDGLGEVADGVLEETEIVRGRAGPVIVDAGRTAALIVVGTRGRGALADGLLGSVSSHVVAHAPVPVAVVPDAAPAADTHRRIVVGVDGSPNAVAALAWALDNAAPDVAIQVVHAWAQRVVATPEPYVVPLETVRAAARASLTTTIDEARVQANQPDREVEAHLVGGDARSVLRDAAADADLLVLGSRGHGGVAHLLLGSITTALVHQPNVTTVVVPGPTAR